MPPAEGPSHIGPFAAAGPPSLPPPTPRALRTPALLGLAVLGLLAPAGAGLAALSSPPAAPTPLRAAKVAEEHARARLARDLEALEVFRPGYPFWHHVFSIPDGSVAYGSARDGRLLAAFPVRGDWRQGARWDDDALAALLDAEPLESALTPRRDQVARLLEPAVGPVVHNATRGNFVLPNVRVYGGFLQEWATIYERFAVPAEIGLAQALVESGFNGKIRSRADAHGLCQFLRRNWQRLDRLTPFPIEIQNQTTQAPYCAAYLTVLATKYGSFIPALSEHHAGGANVGRVLINGERLGASDVRERYFAGSEFFRQLREASSREFRSVVGTYGTRSALYAEMVFGNAATVREFLDSTSPETIHAMRTTRAVPLAEITRRTGLSEREVKRFNPALVRQVPKGATLYLPRHVPEFGADVAFWHRPADPAYAEVLAEFVSLDVSADRWEDPEFEGVLRDFRRRFRETRTEEGAVMDAALAYAMQEIPSTRRVLTAYRTNPEVRQAFDRGLELRRTTLLSEAPDLR